MKHTHRFVFALGLVASLAACGDSGGDIMNRDAATGTDTATAQDLGTPGADFHPDLHTADIEAVFRKGAYGAAYSGFEGTADGMGLADWLRARGVDEVDIVGIATDYCVRATALDAARAGFDTRVLVDLTAGVSPDSTAAALAEMSGAGVELVSN